MQIQIVGISLAVPPVFDARSASQPLNPSVSRSNRFQYHLLSTVPRLLRDDFRTGPPRMHKVWPHWCCTPELVSSAQRGQERSPLSPTKVSRECRYGTQWTMCGRPKTLPCSIPKASLNPHQPAKTIISNTVKRTTSASSDRYIMYSIQ